MTKHKYSYRHIHYYKNCWQFSDGDTCNRK